MQIRLPTTVEVNKVGDVLIMDVRIETNPGKIENYALNLEPLSESGMSYGDIETQSEQKPCSYYMRTGLCRFGVACKFHHFQLASTRTVLPVTSPIAFGSTGVSITLSSGLPYVGAIPTWSLPRAPYMPGPRWNTYMGDMSPISSTSILGSNLVYNTKNEVESGSSGQVHLLSSSIPHLPERRDQPECWYFMSTGSCKYNSDCKYHHPK
ncbi:Zinc finger CCCH domain-containing protein 12 [Vitis vinifera]|uniref:Zinc finger CCCH domain-containing protein 12 n=1 Tax=Vitis vinifera TaxID=29760 RepID=A0A438J9L0_VITVI|nr:Zinc finger CCCH domain-containing protein 12 [Vitis vinifera]